MKNEEFDGNASAGVEPRFDDVGMDGFSLRWGAGIDKALKSGGHGDRALSTNKKEIRRERHGCIAASAFGP